MTQPINPSRRNFLASGLTGAAAIGAGLTTATQAVAQPASSGSLEGKVALVTGAARGIGRGIAEEYARQGASVVMVDIADPTAVPAVEGFRIANTAEFEEAFEAVRAINSKTLHIRGDVRLESDLDGAVSKALEQFGGLDIAVANAGYVRWHSFADSQIKDWQSVLDVNVWGVANTFRAAIPALRQRGGGRLISISSIGGRQGVPGNGAYTASKWAVIGLTKQAAIELGPDNITANSIAPGPVDTPMYRSAGQMASMGVSSAAEQDAVINPMLPVGEHAALAPVDVAKTAVFLASEAGAALSGTTLDVALGYNAFYTA